MKRLIAFLLMLIMAASVCLAEDAVSSASVPADAASDAPSADGQKILVAYFSRAGENYRVGVVEKGNTEIIAEMIADALGADLFRIEPVVPYPDGYDDCTSVAMAEKNASARPEIIGAVADFDDYDVIYLGYPIWWGDMPMAVYTFLESYDFSGKVIVPFCTHGGSGLAGTPESIQAVCADATVDGGFAITGETAQSEPDAARERVLAWLGGESQR